MQSRSLPMLHASQRRALPVLLPVRAEDREAKPNYVVWELTLKCDLRCEHCGSRAGSAREGELSTAEAIALAVQVAELGVQEVTLIGGEAYLHDGWLDIITTLAERGVYVSMATGGRGMTVARAKAAMDAGLQSLGVSVDGLEDVHDVLRARRGSFQLALGALRVARAVGLRISANSQINQQSLPQLEALFDVLAAEGIAGWQIQLTVPSGRAADRPDLMLQPYQLLDLMPRLARLAERARAQGIRFSPGNDVGYFGPYESTLRPHGPRKPCNAGRGVMGIESDGSIKGCPSLPSSHYIGGSIRHAKLLEIWEGSPELRFTRGRTSEGLWGFCKTCYYADDCLAGCSWMSHALFGKLGNNPYCHHRALELQSRGLRERVQLQTPAPGLPFDNGIYELHVECI